MQYSPASSADGGGTGTVVAIDATVTVVSTAREVDVRGWDEAVVAGGGGADRVVTVDPGPSGNSNPMAKLARTTTAAAATRASRRPSLPRSVDGWCPGSVRRSPVPGGSIGGRASV